jgi:BirA family biotin operon repressor/biotin-[acetyl-CoA-carboxylase] ligase
MKTENIKSLQSNNDFISGKELTKKIRAVFNGEIIGREIIFFKSTTSTNDRAMEIGQQRENPEGIVVIADTQRRGRGRLGRSWISPPKVNLYFTVLLRPPFLPKEAPILTLMAAVAVVYAIREYVGLNAEIKWPNDILINDKKVGGILMEMKSGMDRIALVAIGIGVNVNMPLSLLREDIRPLATSLKEESGKSIDRIELLGRILAKLENCYKILLSGDKRTLIKEWLSLNSTIGNNVIVQMQDRVISGVAEGIDEDGGLIVRLSSGDVERVSAGDVKYAFTH